MTNKPKAIGTRGESVVTRYLQDHGFPHAERRALAGSSDRGDILVTAGVIAEVKAGATARQAGPLQVHHWLAETEAERKNANAAIGILVVQRLNRHLPGAAGWQAFLPLRSVQDLLCPLIEVQDQLSDQLGAVGWSSSLAGVVALLRHAGYGNPLPDMEGSLM